MNFLVSSVALVDINNTGGGFDQSFLPGSDTKGVGFIFPLIVWCRLRLFLWWSAQSPFLWMRWLSISAGILGGAHPWDLHTHLCEGSHTHTHTFTHVHILTHTCAELLFRIQSKHLHSEAPLYLCWASSSNLNVWEATPGKFLLTFAEKSLVKE